MTRTPRRVVAPVLLGVLVLAGCARVDLPEPPPVPTGPTSTPTRSSVAPSTSTTSSSATASSSTRAGSADDLDLTDVRVCPLFTPATLAAAGVGGADVLPGLLIMGATSSCTARLGIGSTFEVSVFPTTSLETWQATSLSVASAAVAGFPAAAAPAIRPEDPVRCAVAVGTAPSATLVASRYATPTLASDADACPQASTMAAAVIAALRASR